MALGLLAALAGGALLAPAPGAQPRQPRSSESFVLLHPDESATVDSLVAAERRFSALSVEKGTRTAFLTFLSDSGVVFRPLPVNGKRAWESSPAAAGTLIWEPAFAEVSLSGDLGYTTGPWEYYPAAERNLPTSYGHFCSVWKREASGQWRVALDLGVSHRKPERGVGSGDFRRGMSLHVSAPVPPTRGQRTDMAALDRDFGKATRSKGIRRALTDRAAADLRFNTDGSVPAFGPREAIARADTLAGSLSFATHGSGLAPSDDLGYTYGIAERRARSGAAADSSVYLHVWRRGPDHRWKLALAVWNPLRP